MEHIGEVYNEMEVSFDSHSSNEAFARVTVAAFMTQLLQWKRCLMSRRLCRKR